LTNTSNGQIRIENIRLKSSNNEIGISAIPNPPVILDSGDVITITLNFAPVQMKDYSDSMIVEVSQPCEETFTSNISGTGTGKMLVWLPDVSKDVGYSICIPLYAKLLNEKDIKLDTKFSGEIRFDATALMPKNIYSIIGNDRVIDYQDIGLNINKDTNVIAELCGTVLLARDNTTALRITDFSLANPFCEVETKDGSLTILGCVIDISRVIMSHQPEIIFYPNPAGDVIQIVIRSKEKANLKIEIINNLGINRTQIFEGEVKIGESEITFSTDNKLPSGTYWLKVIINGTEQIVKPLLIVH